MSQDKQTHLSLINAVAYFMRTAGQSTGRFNGRQACLYLGLQLEELAEKIDAVIGGCLTEQQRLDLYPLSHCLHTFATRFKEGQYEGHILRSNHADLIDADFDSAWVALGSLMSISTDPIGAVAHGAYTNLDKFRSTDRGVLHADLDQNGKVKKRPGWTPPNFEPYTDKSVRG